MKRAASLLLAAAAAAGLVAAQKTETVSVLIPFADKQGIMGSIISAAPSGTAYLLTCPTGTSETECGLGTGVEIFYGPETISYALEFESYTMSAACRLNTAADEASCSGGMVQGTSSELYTSVVDFTAYIQPVTVTAGWENLEAGATATGTAPTGTGAAGETSSSSAGGMPRVTGNPVVMGAAVAVAGGVAMLI